MRNTAVTGGEPIAMLRHVAGVTAVNPLVGFYDKHRSWERFLLSETCNIGD
jgi:hypothetical protein